MWDFFTTVRYRHSVRRYQPRPVEQEKLHAVLEMACAAPSAGDLQSYHITVIDSAALKAELARAAGGQTFIEEAPLCLVFCADRVRASRQFGTRGATLYALQDATIAAAYAQLAIVAAGMGSTWVGQFDAREVARLLKLADQLEPVALLSMGHPAELPADTSRRRLEDLVRRLDQEGS